MGTPFVNLNNLTNFAWTNANELKGPARAIALDFHGLGYGGMRENGPGVFDLFCAEKGILTVFPYYGPWSWMNFQAIALVDAVVAAAKEKFGLAADAPVISTGGSMGGLSALIYTRYARVTPTACAANCPVCDLPYHATERPDLPRTMVAAFAGYPCSIELAMELHSPLHQAAGMPRVPYYVVHGGADKAVNQQKHSDRFVAAMREAGQSITYRVVEPMEHCDLKSFPEAEREYYDFIAEAAGCK